jgi:hypothetical protein
MIKETKEQLNRLRAQNKPGSDEEVQRLERLLLNLQSQLERLFVRRAKTGRAGDSRHSSLSPQKILSSLSRKCKLGGPMGILQEAIPQLLPAGQQFRSIGKKGGSQRLS